MTHLFDVFPLPAAPCPETGVYPAGLVDYLLIEDRLACEIIPDGTHVHPLLVEKAFRCKPSDGLVFVSDSNFGAGLPPGEYDLPNRRGRAIISGPNDGLRLADRDLMLAGSALTPAHGFRNAMALFGKDLSSASRVCSRNPARLLGLNKGEMKPGRDADLVELGQGGVGALHADDKHGFRAVAPHRFVDSRRKQKRAQKRPRLISGQVFSPQNCRRTAGRPVAGAPCCGSSAAA